MRHLPGGPDASQWHDAMQAEMDAMERLEAFQKVPIRSVPEGEKVLPSRWVYKIKPGKYRARICVRGDLSSRYHRLETLFPLQ